MPHSQKRRPARGGADLCLAAWDRQHTYNETPGKATIVGVSPAGHDRVRVWSWAPDSIVLPLGTYSRSSLPTCLTALLRGRPRAELFIMPGAI